MHLSESLGGVPGLQIQNRQNLAQDLQLSMRGFGARSTFGVRGVRLYVDGIPATLPDGQGQTSNIDIGSARPRRDPARAVLGAVRQFVRRRDPGLHRRRAKGRRAWASRSPAAASARARIGTQASGSSGAVDYLLSASRFQTDG